MDWSYIIAACVAAVAVGLSKGGLPMIGMLAVPVLSLSESPLKAAGLLLPIYVVSDIFGIIAYRREFDRRNLAILIPAGIAGIMAGWATASLIPERAVTLLVGLIGLGFCLDIALKRGKTIAPRPADLPRGIFWGAIAGFTSFVSHSGAPPYQMYVLPQRLEKMVFAGTSTILFAIINFVKLLPYYALGQLSFDSVKAMLPFYPVAIAATYAGVALTRVLPQDVFFKLVLAALLLVSIKLCFDAILG